MDKGQVHVITDFYSKALGSQRTFRVCLPPDYDNSQERYPVVYMHDGQWSFSEEGKRRWNADLTAWDLMVTGSIPPIILVGVDCNEADRRRELSHTTPPPFRRMGRRGYIPCHSFEGEGLGFSYEMYMADEVKSYIDSHYRTKPEREHTLLAGSSMGGLVTLCMGMNRHETYGMLGLLSPAVHWLSDEFYNSMEHYGQKIWLDCGMAESYYVDNTRELYHILRGLGYEQGKDLHYLAEPEAVHTEQYFAQRFRMLLLWIFGKKTEPKTVTILGSDTAALNGYATMINTVIIYENGIMQSDMEGSYRSDPPGILKVEPHGEVRAVSAGRAMVTYEKGNLKAAKEIRVVNALSRDVLLHILVEIPRETPQGDPIVYHFFRDQYCVLEKKSDTLYEGELGVPRDWEFYGHFCRCIEDRDKKRECTADRKEVNRFVRTSKNQTLHYVVEAWQE